MFQDRGFLDGQLIKEVEILKEKGIYKPKGFTLQTIDDKLRDMANNELVCVSFDEKRRTIC